MWTNDGLVCWRIYVPLRLDALKALANIVNRTTENPQDMAK